MLLYNFAKINEKRNRYAESTRMAKTCLRTPIYIRPVHFPVNRGFIFNKFNKLNLSRLVVNKPLILDKHNNLIYTLNLYDTCLHISLQHRKKYTHIRPSR